MTMRGTKRGARSVGHAMTNEQTTTPRRARIARVARSRKKQTTTTSVRVPMMGWQSPDPLHVKRGGQDQMLKRVLQTSASRARPISIGVHDEKCPLSIFVLPRMSDVDDFVALNECVAERDGTCTCTPTILYTGAKA